MGHLEFEVLGFNFFKGLHLFQCWRLLESGFGMQVDLVPQKKVRHLNPVSNSLKTSTEQCPSLAAETTFSFGLRAPFFPLVVTSIFQAAVFHNSHGLSSCSPLNEYCFLGDPPFQVGVSGPYSLWQMGQKYGKTCAQAAARGARKGSQWEKWQKQPMDSLRIMDGVLDCAFLDRYLITQWHLWISNIEMETIHDHTMSYQLFSMIPIYQL